MKSILLIFKIWLISFIILSPLALSFCKAAKMGDKGNKFINSAPRNLNTGKGLPINY